MHISLPLQHRIFSRSGDIATNLGYISFSFFVFPHFVSKNAAYILLGIVFSLVWWTLAFLIDKIDLNLKGANHANAIHQR